MHASSQQEKDAASIISSARDYADHLKSVGGRPKFADYEYYKNRMHSVNVFSRDKELARVLGV